MLENGKFGGGGKAMDGHMVKLAPVAVASLCEPGYIGENGKTSILPVFWVPLPEILGIVRSLQAHKLCAQCGYLGGYGLILNGIDHGFVLLSSRAFWFAWKYSTAGPTRNQVLIQQKALWLCTKISYENCAICKKNGRSR